MSYSSSDVDLVIPADDDGQRTKIERERTPVPTTQEGPRTNPNKCICHISLNDFKLHRNGIAVAKTVSFIYIYCWFLVGPNSPMSKKILFCLLPSIDLTKNKQQKHTSSHRNAKRRSQKKDTTIRQQTSTIRLYVLVCLLTINHLEKDLSEEKLKGDKKTTRNKQQR